MARAKRFGAEAASAVRRRTFDGKPIVDAEHNFSLIIRESAVRAARDKQKDAGHCVIAEACRDQVGEDITVAIFRRVAYVELPNAKGKREVRRFILDPAAASIVAAFDRGRHVRTDVVVTLKAPRDGQRLDAVLARSRRNRENHRIAVINGTISERGGSSHRVNVMDIRHGAGLVHNSVKAQ
jgi:hypothetical protein